MAGFQPFAITEFKTGLFQYLQPWIRPIDAFEPLVNAYVYRGTLNKRQGYFPFGLDNPHGNGNGQGRLYYQDYLATGNGGNTYTGTLTLHPIIQGSFGPFSNVETFTDNGDGTLTGSMGGTGTINYTTGVWSVTFAAAVPATQAIYANFSPFLSSPRIIMGIKTWTNESDGSQKLVVADTRRISVFDDTSQMFMPVNSINQIIWVSDGTTTSINLDTGWAAVSPYSDGLARTSITLTDGTSTIQDDGLGGFNSSGNFTAGSTVNYSTGIITLKYAAVKGKVITMTAKLAGDYFTGGASNFFNSTNWLGYLYLTNNIDRITRYNGTALDRPVFAITQANSITYTNNIGTALGVDTYKNRLLLERPVLVNNPTTGTQGQSIRFSAINNATNFIADVTGNGGENSAPTDDFIQSAKFLRDVLVVNFGTSVWIFRFTGSQFDPFRWDKVSVAKSTNAPYASISYDERVTAMGAKGLIACDGVNVQRYDISIIDQFLDIQQKSFAQCFAERYDSLNQTWHLYPSIPDQNTFVGTTLSDSVLVYNFLEQSWSIFNISMSCLGIYHIVKDVTWSDFAANLPLGEQWPSWNVANFPWNYYLNVSFTPALLGGGQDGIVYEMDNGTTDNGNPIFADITSTRWNPFIKDGQKVQLGYIDFYYEAESNAAPAILEISFYVDNSEDEIVPPVFLTLDAPTPNTAQFKRVYINLTGQFFRMNIYSGSQATFVINGIVIWCRPAGRLTP
jgi:hypothetical protein